MSASVWNGMEWRKEVKGVCLCVCHQLGIESETRLTESVHLNPPQNMRESVVVTRRFLFRRD